MDRGCRIRLGLSQSKFPFQQHLSGKFSILTIVRASRKGYTYPQYYVMLYDRSRNNKQPASRHHSLLRLNLEDDGQLSASLQDLHSYITRFTVIIEPTGHSTQVNNSKPSPLCSGSTLHFCPLVPQLPQEDRYEEYTGFKFSFHYGLLPRQEFSKTGELAVQNTLPGHRYANQQELRLVVISSLIGRLIGMGGSTIRRIRQAHRSSIFISGNRQFHPDAVVEQGRVIHCSALDHTALCSTAVSVIQTLFTSIEGTNEQFNLYFVIPTASARLLTMGEGQFLAHLTSAHKTDFRLRDPHRLAPSERLLAATGPISVLPAMISELLALFAHPFQYTSMAQPDYGTRSGEEHRPQQSALDLPLNMVAQRYKRKNAQERADNRATKRAKPSAWRRPYRNDKATE